MKVIPEKMLKHFVYLGLQDARIEEKIQEILESEYRRRLTRYEHIDRILKRR